MTRRVFSGPVRIPPVSIRIPASAVAIATFTAGPATAMTSSIEGLSGICSILATPPIGSSVMSGVRMP